MSMPKELVELMRKPEAKKAFIEFARWLAKQTRLYLNQLTERTVNSEGGVITTIRNNLRIIKIIVTAVSPIPPFKADQIKAELLPLRDKIIELKRRYEGPPKYRLYKAEKDLDLVLRELEWSKEKVV